MIDGGYKIRNQAAIHFITFVVVNGWIQVFELANSQQTMNEVRLVFLLESISGFTALKLSQFL